MLYQVFCYSTAIRLSLLSSSRDTVFPSSGEASDDEDDVIGRAQSKRKAIAADSGEESEEEK